MESRQFISATSKELQVHCLESHKSVFINVGTLEIYCFTCSMEILDESVKSLLDPHKPIVAFKKLIKDNLRGGVLKTFSSIEHYPELAVFPSNTLNDRGINFINQVALTNTFSTALYTLWGIPYFRTVANQ